MVTAMDVRWKSMIIWPQRDHLRRTIPNCFREALRDKVSVVNGCFEIFAEQPSNYLARLLAWSQYKQHNLVKLLIDIAPQGSVSYIFDLNPEIRFKS